MASVVTSSGGASSITSSVTASSTSVVSARARHRLTRRRVRDRCDLKMQIAGGKARIAKRVAQIVNAERGTRELWEPFMGGLWATAALGGKVRASDIHPGLANLYNAVRDGLNLPDVVTREDYEVARKLPVDSALRTFVGFGCSWGGKFFGGYAGGLNGKLTYAQLAKRNVEMHVRSLWQATFTCESFFEREPESNVMAYLDPPYAGTTPYAGVEAWNPERFSARVKEWVDAGAVLYVSEYAFPFGDVVFERTAKRTLGASNGEMPAVTERLYRCAKDPLDSAACDVYTDKT